MDMVDQNIAFESGELDEAGTIALFQSLLDTGTIWGLQGFYHRTLQALIGAGLVHSNDPAC